MFVESLFRRYVGYDVIYGPGNHDENHYPNRDVYPPWQQPEPYHRNGYLFKER